MQMFPALLVSPQIGGAKLPRAGTRRARHTAVGIGTGAARQGSGWNRLKWERCVHAGAGRVKGQAREDPKMASRGSESFGIFGGEGRDGATEENFRKTRVKVQFILVLRSIFNPSVGGYCSC